MDAECTDVERLHRMLAAGELVHPYLNREHFKKADDPDTAGTRSPPTANFVDLSAALALCCGADDEARRNAPGEPELLDGDRRIICSSVEGRGTRRRRMLELAAEIGRGPAGGGAGYRRRHIVLILCDGMGNSILNRHLAEEEGSFFRGNNQPSRLRAVFPSTTTAALTSLATASWPGRHGMPGWNLRDKRGCDLPGTQGGGVHQPAQLLVLSDRIRDARSGDLASAAGFRWDDVFVEEPWARKLAAEPKGSRGSGRRMVYVNAYNGDDYQDWSQGSTKPGRGGTDFSTWFIGNKGAGGSTCGEGRSLFETSKIGETSFETLGKPEGSAKAIEYFRQGIDAAIRSIREAETSGESTFVYLYTAHPDMHMHALGVEHAEVKEVVRGIESEVERLWTVLGDRNEMLGGDARASESPRVDAAVVVTADHGHVTVDPDDMVQLPEGIVELLEYACIGVHGKGRHGYLHCRAGLRDLLRRRWRAEDVLRENFLLLTIEEAIDAGLYGPEPMRVRVRPRLGDFVAVSVGRRTLATPDELDMFAGAACRCQGAHGSLLAEEMEIPFICLTTEVN